MSSPHCIRSDLRSSNVLLAADGTAKLGDVGLAALAANVSGAGSSEGAFPYAAPELLMGACCTEKVWEGTSLQTGSSAVWLQPCGWSLGRDQTRTVLCS